MSNIIISDSIRKVYQTRKGELHRCDTCSRQIPYRTEVRKITGIDEGECGRYTFLMCLPCCDMIDDEGWDTSDGISEYLINETLEYYYSENERYWLRVRYFGYGDEKF